MLFFALGYCCFDFIQRLFAWDCLHKKIICVVAGLVCLIYAMALFLGRNLLGYINNNVVMELLCAIFGPMIIIFLVLIVSRLVDNVNLLTDLGENTLFLCGLEYIVKLIVPICFQTIGLNLSLSTPITVYLYTFVLLVVCNKILVPWQKRIFKKIHLI